jgi:DNA-binding NarL/FixJ family response regulator
MPSHEGDHGFALTTRQISILQLLVGGLTNVEIGNALHLSKYTVSQHVREMLRRTGAVNRTDLATRALKAGVVEAGVKR